MSLFVVAGERRVWRRVERGKGRGNGSGRRMEDDGKQGRSTCFLSLTVMFQFRI